jgi:phosphonate transport system substrate-binding protein
MKLLRITSCQAPIAESFVEAVAEYIADALNLPVQFVNDIPWEERARQFDAGHIEICWLCGVPYVWRADQPNPPLELLAAPVPAAPRYRDQPIYFSDVVVRHDSPFQTFADLRGARWAINDCTSHSGYYVTRYHLALLAETNGFFSQVIESGAHQRSVQMILDGQIEASAIDSTVLELLSESDPQLRAQLRVINVFGPSPIPPWIIRQEVAPPLRAALREMLTHLHTQPRGREILAGGQLARFAEVKDSDYNPIRRMLELGEAVRL